MRGNHIHWFRNDYTPPPALSPEQLARVATVTVRLKEGTTTWHEVWRSGVLIGYVKSVMGGQSFRTPFHDFWVPSNRDCHPNEPPHARAILALLDCLEETTCVS